jgi:chloramphenicol 3-O-phosphotransferase
MSQDKQELTTAGWEIKHQSGYLELLTQEQFTKRTIEAAGMREMVYKDEVEQISKPNLKVRFGAMPESNGNTNWTAILYVDKGGKLDIADGFQLERSEYKDRVRYSADCMRFLIGEITEEPDILKYDPTLKGNV